jgi:hypothetical protein
MSDTTLPARVLPAPSEGRVAVFSKEHTSHADLRHCDGEQCGALIHPKGRYVRVQLANLLPAESPRSRDDMRAIDYSRRATLAFHPQCCPQEYLP